MTKSSQTETVGGKTARQNPHLGKDASAPAFGFWIAVGLVSLVFISLSIFAAIYLKNSKPGRRIPQVYQSVHQDLEGIERSGKAVRLSSLSNKVVVVAHIYTVCPHGCMALLGEMMKLQKEFGERADFHQVSVAVFPEHDTPEFLRSFVQGLGLPDTAPWWFITGKQEQLWNYMVDGIGLNKPQPIPEEERLNPLDRYAHDLRAVLLDRQQRVRGYYDVTHPQAEIASMMRERLHDDIKFLLDHPEL